jgi:hypothetical protein
LPSSDTIVRAASLGPIAQRRAIGLFRINRPEHCQVAFPSDEALKTKLDFGSLHRSPLVGEQEARLVAVNN